MPPSMFSSEALVIWIFRIAMNAPIMAAITEIHTVALARSGAGVITAAAVTGRGIADEVERARSDMASPLVSSFWRHRSRHFCDASSAMLECEVECEVGCGALAVA